MFGAKGHDDHYKFLKSGKVGLPDAFFNTF